MKVFDGSFDVRHFNEDLTIRTLELRFQGLERFRVKDIAVLDEKGLVRYNVIALEIEGQDFYWR